MKFKLSKKNEEGKAETQAQNNSENPQNTVTAEKAEQAKDKPNGKKEKKNKKPKKKASKKKIIIIALVALGICAAVFAFLKIKGKKVAENVINTAIADRGDIELTVSGTGMIEANEQYEVTSLVRGEIIADYFEEGDTVSEGDLLYKIDTTDVENSIERSKVSLEKSQNSYNQNLKDSAKLSIKAPVSGTITTLYVKKGDNVNSNTKIAEITDSSKMILTVPFIDEHVSESVSVGNSAEITLLSTNDKVYGTVSKIITGTYVNGAGVVVRNVEITINNPGSVKEGDKATAIVGDVACNDSGTFKNYDSKTVTSEVSGTITSLPYAEGDTVSAGAQLVALKSETLENSLTSGRLSIKESQLSLENTYNSLDDYSIKSPISGTVIQKTSKAGDNLDNTNSSVTMAVIADMSRMLFTMAIDELDISKIEEGQEVEIVADAMEDVTFTGYVDEVSIVGTSANGVTTYPVTVVVNDPDGLIPGMNVSATIIIEKRENVVRVPISSVRRGNIVAVKGASSKNASDDDMTPDMPEDMPEGTPENSEGEDKEKKPVMGGGIPDGFTSVTVKTGINDDSYIEIISGIEEGDEVWVPQIASSSDSQQNQMGGMPGGEMGGGMPGGGMGGGMPGGGGGGMPGGGMR